jgi:uncharacterized protein (DUF3820 family)
MEDILPKKDLIEMVMAKMPFGKYKGKYLVDLPDAYFVWFKRKGFPNGKLGKQIQSVGDLKANGAGGMLRAVRDEVLRNF